MKLIRDTCHRNNHYPKVIKRLLKLGAVEKEKEPELKSNDWY